MNAAYTLLCKNTYSSIGKPFRPAFLELGDRLARSLAALGVDPALLDLRAEAQKMIRDPSSSAGATRRKEEMRGDSSRRPLPLPSPCDLLSFHLLSIRRLVQSNTSVSDARSSLA